MLIAGRVGFAELQVHSSQWQIASWPQPFVALDAVVLANRVFVLGHLGEAPAEVRFALSHFANDRLTLWARF